MPYRLFTPAHVEPGQAYPLVVSLHGAGGSGTDNAKQLEGGNVFGALVKGPLVTDAYVAALAIEHGCELVTTDSEFARFPGLRWRHPLAAP
jgi:predicted peptidase